MTGYNPLQSPIGSLQLVPVIVANGVGVGVVPVNPPPLPLTDEVLVLPVLPPVDDAFLGKHPELKTSIVSTANGILNCFIKHTFKKFLNKFIGGLGGKLKIY